MKKLLKTVKASGNRQGDARIGRSQTPGRGDCVYKCSKRMRAQCVFSKISRRSNLTIIVLNKYAPLTILVLEALV